MPKTLLLADDSVVIQKLVGLSFANEDVDLVTTDNGDDALARAREIAPDLVLADVVMPGKNGYEVCQAIKSDPALGHTPVLLLTGTFEAFDEDRARQVGSDGHITKPFEAQGLVDRVTDLLSRPRPAPAAPATAPAAPAAPPTPTPVPETPAAQPAPVAPAPETPAGEEAYDFFDDDVQELAAPETPAAAPMPASNNDSFEFGEELDPMGANEVDSDTLDTNFELDPAPPDDLTVAVVGDTPPIAPPPVPLDIDAPDATQVALGETVVADDFGAPEATPVTSLDDSLPAPPAVPTPPIAPKPAAVEDPGQTMLADDLFADPAPSPPPVPEAPAAAPEKPAAAPEASSTAPEMPAAASPAAPAVPEAPPAVSQPSDMPPPMDSGFEFGFDDAAPSAAATPGSEVGEDITAPSPAAPEAPEALDDPLAGMASAPDDFRAEPIAEAPELADAAESTHSGYDVSSSDLGSPLEAGPALPAVEPAAAATPESPLESPPPLSASAPIVTADPEPVGPTAALVPAAPDLSPMMQERVHEMLEKVAWEAFADLSDNIVQQVLQRVESVVWDVVPQMAEALIQEEIRRMKGED